jgi:opacity protein-like surface antigen
MRLGVFVLSALVVVPTLAVPLAAAEEKRVHFGLEGNWSDDVDFGLGARVDVGLSGKSDGLGAFASFNYFFPSTPGIEGVDFDSKYWEANANVTYTLHGKIAPYFGAGLNLAHASVTGTANVGPDFDIEAEGASTQVGLNLLGGLRVNERFFVETKIELGGGETFMVGAGVRF